jgi:hypothetical protein
LRRTSELARFLGDAPLAGDERQEEYDSFFAAIVSKLTQPDVINDLYVKDFVNATVSMRPVSRLGTARLR